jgi:hypothetical protein
MDPNQIEPEIKRDAFSRAYCDSRPPIERRLALLRKLEASLVSSHRALLSLDLAAIKQGTSDQSTLSESLALEIRRSRNASDRGPIQPSELLQELKRSEWKVLCAARVQAALLKRAQLKLRVMGNMLAGLERNYAAPAVCHKRLRSTLAAENRAEKCQV